MRISSLIMILFLSACSDTVEPACANGVCLGDVGQPESATDKDMPDAHDSAHDLGTTDIGSDLNVADGSIDAGNLTDMATDSATQGDAAVDASADATPGLDAEMDADSATDATVDVAVDMGPVGDCISGATGTHAVRFKWRGNGPGSTAYVGYETNQLPDTSRWKVGAYGRSFSYTPKFNDTFLGIGGLELGSSNFIDVELSTVGLTQLRNATIAILGRSYNTTSSGSFTWMSFDGSGAAPSGLVSNSAPYQWYSADATSAFAAGNSGILLRIEAGGPSNSLIVNSVEICFDAN